MTAIEETLKTEYLRTGGTEAGYETVKGTLLSDYRRQATVDAALKKATMPPNMNDIIRGAFSGRRSNDAAKIEQVFKLQSRKEQ